MNIEEAVQYFNDEIRLCRAAPSINGCQMTEDWQRTIDACEIAVAAIRKVSNLDMARRERDVMTKRMIELEQEVCRLKSRLAAYEDTGLEPEEIYEVRFLIAAQRDPQKLARLRELVLADQDGRLVVLPCKVGDDVWFVRKFGKERCIKRAEVSCINIDCRGEVFVSARRISGGYIGKTVFLTREDAEAALAQKGGEG